MSGKTQQLLVRLDPTSKEYLAKAAELRNVSISDYVRIITVPQAKREVGQADQDVVSLSPTEQLAFWQALNEPVELTDAQESLAQIMRGETSTTKPAKK